MLAKAASDLILASGEPNGAPVNDPPPVFGGFEDLGPATSEAFG
jgi:hypothetical protein